MCHMLCLHTHTGMQEHAQARMRRICCFVANTHVHAYMIHVSAHVHQILMNACIHSEIDMYTHTHAHTHLHARTHAHMHTYTHTCTYTFTTYIRKHIPHSHMPCTHMHAHHGVVHECTQARTLSKSDSSLLQFPFCPLSTRTRHRGAGSRGKLGGWIPGCWKQRAPGRSMGCWVWRHQTSSGFSARCKVGSRISGWVGTAWTACVVSDAQTVYSGKAVRCMGGTFQATADSRVQISFRKADKNVFETRFDREFSTFQDSNFILVPPM